MTISLSGQAVAKQIAERFPEAVSEVSDQAIVVKSESVFEVAEYLKNSQDFKCDYLNYIAAVDYYDYYDLMGIVFEGHPNLKRIVLWEGFPGHPLRKDYL